MNPLVRNKRLESVNLFFDRNASDVGMNQMNVFPEIFEKCISLKKLSLSFGGENNIPSGGIDSFDKLKGKNVKIDI